MPQKSRRADAPQPSEGRYRIASSPETVGDLVSWLCDPRRAVPVALISRHSSGATFTDPGKAAELPADVWVIEPRATFLLSDAVGRQLSVYDGASRIFPVGTDWLGDCHQSPRFLANSDYQQRQQEQRLLGQLRHLTASDSSSTPETSYTELLTIPQATQLAQHLLDDARSHPVVVISIARGASGPYVDADRVADELQGVAQVYVVATGAISWALSDELPPRGDVYGGASRVYPPGADWARDVYRAPLRFAGDAAEGERTTDILISDALRHAPFIEHTAASSAASSSASGTVTVMVANRALIRLDDGQMAHAWPELVARGVAPERVFVQGQRVEGVFDATHKRLIPARRMASEALADVAVGDVVLVRVLSVQSEACVVEPFPEFPVVLPADRVVTDYARVDLRDLMTAGETIPVEVLATGADPQQWRLSALVSDDPQSREAPSVLPDGPPWLLPADEADLFSERPEVEALHAKPEVAEWGLEMPRHGEVDDLRVENRRLMDQVRALDKEIRRLTDETRRQRTRIRKLAARGPRQGSSDAERTLAEDANRFDDPGEQLRFEVYLAWVRRFSDAERKGERRLLEWSIGEDFFASWDEVHGIDRRKVVDVIVEVLTDVAPSMPSRDLHQLRTGPGGDDPPRRRGNYVAWRVSLQSNTPSARRLHYWRDGDRIELSSIRLHDDYRA